MDRRFMTVLGVSLLFALLVSGIFYQVVLGAKGGSSRKQKVEMKDLVVAARALPVGVSLKPSDITLTKVPVDQFPKGCFGKVEEVLDRPVVSSILPEEPIREGRLAARGSGLGLAPTIPPGMRAVSVKVNEVVGVAGFVLPGMRVDVLVTGRMAGKDRDETRTKTILQDIPVLSAGSRIEPDARGQAYNAPVVTLLVTPAQAELLTLASENRIQLVLRNGSDRSVDPTPGRDMGELFGKPASAPAPVARPAPRPRPAVETAALAVTPPPPTAADVVVFRGTTKTVEQVPVRRQ